MVVEYFLGDHLGSTSITTDTAGAKVSEMRYKPFGEVRYTWKDATLTQTTPAYALTKWTFTGQYSYADDPSTPGVEDFGLLYFNARFYDPALGRFSSADTVIPGAGDPQAWDRYAYANNSPLNYVDPTGHFGQCREGQSGYECRITQNKVAALEQQWTSERAARAAQLQATRASTSLNNLLNCRDRVCESGVTLPSSTGVDPQGESRIGLDFAIPEPSDLDQSASASADGGPDWKKIALYAGIAAGAVLIVGGVLLASVGVAMIGLGVVELLGGGITAALAAHTVAGMALGLAFYIPTGLFAADLGFKTIDQALAP